MRLIDRLCAAVMGLGLVAVMAMSAGIGCKHARMALWNLQIGCEFPAAVVTPDSGPMLVLAVNVTGTTSDALDVAFEFSRDAGSTFEPMMLDSAAAGTVDGAWIRDFPTGFEPVAVRWNSRDCDRSAVESVVFRITAHDVVNERPASQRIQSAPVSIDNTAGPALQPPLGPGTVMDGDPIFETVLVAGDSLESTLTATHPDPAMPVTVSMRVTGGSLSATEAGFVSPFPTTVGGSSPVMGTTAGTAKRPGSIELTVEVEDENGLRDALILRITIANTAPTISLAQAGAGQLTGTNPTYTLILHAGDAFAVDFLGTDADDGQLLTMAFSPLGGSLATPTAVGISSNFDPPRIQPKHRPAHNRGHRSNGWHIRHSNRIERLRWGARIGDIEHRNSQFAADVAAAQPRRWGPHVLTAG